MISVSPQVPGVCKPCWVLALLGSQVFSQQLERSKQGLGARMLFHCCSQQCEPGWGVGPSLLFGTALSPAQPWPSLPSLQPSNPSAHKVQKAKSWVPYVSATSVTPHDAIWH